MKTELMEYLVRICVKEVLDQVQGAPVNANEFHRDEQGVWCKTCGNKGKAVKLPNGDTAYSCGNSTCKAYRNLVSRGRLEECDEDDQESHSEHEEEEGGKKLKVKIKPDKVSLKIGEQDSGELAPPAGGLGTGDAPALPKEPGPGFDEPEKEEPKEEPEEAPPTPAPEKQGIKLINPRDKSRIVNLSNTIKPGNDQALETALFNAAARIAGNKVKVANSTMRQVKSALQSPGTSLFLYLGKYDEASEEIFLMADKSLQVAKDSSVPPTEITGTPISSLSPGAFNPRSATDAELIKRAAAQSRGQLGMTPRHGIGIDEQFKSVVEKIVNEVLNRA